MTKGDLPKALGQAVAEHGGMVHSGDLESIIARMFELAGTDLDEGDDWPEPFPPLEDEEV